MRTRSARQSPGGIVVKHALQGLCGGNATQFTIRIREQMWIRQVQDLNRISVICSGGRLNRPIP